MTEKIKEVTFITIGLKSSYEELQFGKFEDKELFKFLTRAKEDLQKDPLCGTRVPERLIPNEYKQKYGVNALL